MPKSCVVGGCTCNILKNPEVFWLLFPKDSATQRAWVRFLNNTRSDFTLGSSSFVCSANFTDDCIDETLKMKRSLCLPFRFRLEVGSVPSIKAPTVSVMHQRPTPSTSTGIPSTSADVQTQSDEPGPSTRTADSVAERSGGAYLKRERARVCTNHRFRLSNYS